MKRKFGIILLVTGSVIACSKSNNTNSTNYTADCSGATKTYADNVSPIIQAYCTLSGCHATGSNNGPGALTTYQEVSNAQASIRSAVASGAMPQGSSLSSTQKNTIICWIDNGALDN